MLTRVCALVARGCLKLGVAGLVLLLAAVIWQVFGRYVLNDTPATSAWSCSGRCCPRAW